MIESLKYFNVLYVDDDKVTCENMKNTLSYFFQNVFIERNGADALDTYHKEMVHILLVDYDMPFMDGAEFLQEIRKINETIPAVIISSYSDKEKLMAAIKLNLVSYLVKPLEFNELKNLLDDCVVSMKKNNLLSIMLSDDTQYDFSTKTISHNQIVQTTLTNYEFRIFEYLLSRKNNMVTFEGV